MYGTLEGWRSYAEQRGNTKPRTASDELATAALLRASDYIRVYYAKPNSVDTIDPPADYVECTYVIASYELDTPNLFTVVTTERASGNKVLTKVEGIEWTPVSPYMPAPGKKSYIPVSSFVEALIGGNTGPVTAFMAAVG